MKKETNKKERNGIPGEMRKKRWKGERKGEKEREKKNAKEER